MHLNSQEYEYRASDHLYSNRSRRSSNPPPRCKVNLNMFQSPDTRHGIPHRIGPVFKGMNTDLTPVDLPPILPDLSYSTFTCFSSLPYDIRHMIWELLIVPRNLDVWPTSLGSVHYVANKHEHERGVELGFKLWGLTSRTRPPRVLQISQESREIALKHYVLSFGTEYESTFGDSASIATSPRIYYNIGLDRVCLMGSDLETPGVWKHYLQSVIGQHINHYGMTVAFSANAIQVFMFENIRHLDRYKDVIIYTPQDPRPEITLHTSIAISFEPWSEKEDVITPALALDMYRICRISMFSLFRVAFRTQLIEHCFGLRDPSEETQSKKPVAMPKISWRMLVIGEAD